MKKRTKRLITCLLAAAVAATALPGGLVKAATEKSWTRGDLTNYAWTGTVSSSNTNESLATNYPASNLTDGGPWATRAFNQAAVINYTDENLAYYEVTMTTVAKINQVRCCFNQAEANRRPLDIAVDIKKSDDTWVRAAERHNIKYDTDLVIEGTSVKGLDFNFAAIEDAKVIRVTANRTRNYTDATNFALQQLEAYMDTALTSADYTGTTKDSNDSYNIPEQQTSSPEGGEVSGISQNFALNGEVTSSNTNDEFAEKYPASLLTDGIPYYTRPVNQSALINYMESGLAYYQVKMTEKAEINQVRVYLNQAEPERRAKDIAVDIKKADGSWVRVAEMHDIDYDKALVVTDNPRYLAFHFEKTEAAEIRVTANNARNEKATNFRLMEVEAYYDPAVTAYTGTVKDTNENYNIPELGTESSESGEQTVISKNYALNGTVTSSNTNKELGEKYPASQLTDGIPYYTRGAGQTSVINYTAQGLAAYQIELTEKAELNQVRVYFSMHEPEKRPKDIAVDVKKANGTWVRVAEMHDIDYDKALIVTDNPRYLAFNFEKIEATAIRVTANNARNAKSATNFRLMEVEAYYDPSVTTYTGTTKDANTAYNIPLNGGAPETGDAANAVLPGIICVMSLFGIAALMVWRKKKKLIGMLSAVLVLCVAFSVPSLAYTKDSEWSRGIGGSLIDITEDGAKLAATENGLSTWIYKQDPIDITDFSVTFTLSQNYWWPGHGSDTPGYYDAIFLLNKNTFSGSNGPFLLLQPLDAGTLRIEGQIVNCGLLLSPSYVLFNVDTTQPITLRGKLLDESHYRFSIDGDDNNFYDFEIPLNYPFHTDLDGKGYFCVGAATNDNTATGNAITVTSVNGIDFTGIDPDSLKEPANAEDPKETDKDSTVATDKTETDKVNTDKTETDKDKDATDRNKASVSSVDVVLLICIGVLVLVIVAGVLFYFLYIKKKMDALREGTDK